LAPLAISNVPAGVLKYHSISKFFDSILDGSANSTAPNSQVPEGGFKSTSEGEEIERRQKLVKEHNADFHALRGSTARPGDSSESNQMGEEDTHERLENPIHRAIRIQLKKEEQAAKDAARDSMPEAGDTDQDILELRTDTESAHLFTTMNINVQPSASESCIPSGTTDSMALSCATQKSQISETEVPPAHEGTLNPELGHVKDEL
jgi:protein disulfide-isomerase A6